MFGSVVFSCKKVVWNSTFEIGAGTARSTVHGDIICVRYSPRGAEGGPDDFKRNILPNTGMFKGTKSVEGGANLSVGAQERLKGSTNISQTVGKSKNICILMM